MQGVRASKLLYPYKNRIQKLKRVGATKLTIPAIFTSPLKVPLRHRTSCIRTVWKNEWQGGKHQLIMFFTFRKLDFLGDLMPLEKIGNCNSHSARFFQGLVQFFQNVFFHGLVIQDLFRLIIQRKPTYFTFDFTFLGQVPVVFRPATAKFHDHVSVNLVCELPQKRTQR